MTRPLDMLIFAFAPGRSLSRWASLGRLDRETHLLGGLSAVAPKILFVTDNGPQDYEIARALSADLQHDIDAISIARHDPELGSPRPLAERVLARLDGEQRVVVQTMQLDDGGISASIVGPLRRAGIQAAVVARGAFINSRAHAADAGPHSHPAVVAGAEEQALCRIAQIAVGASASMLDDLAWRHGINPARTRVIPHFVTDQQPPVPAHERERHTLLAVGSLDRNRGLDTIINAVARLPEPLRRGVCLRFIGDGPERHTLADLARKAGVRLELPGRVPHEQVIEHMRRCTIFVYASPLRFQSRSVVEAMASGCAVAVTDTPEFDGLVENASTGIRVKPHAEAFAFALESLLTDADWREMLGSSASRITRTECALQRVVQLCRDCYADALTLAPSAVPGRLRRTG